MSTADFPPQGGTTPFKVTQKEYESLRAAYDKAVADGKQQFTHEGHEFVTAYAKHLLQYLAPRFERKKGG